MTTNSPSTPSGSILSQNMVELIGNQHTITSLSRDLNIHRNQLQRYVDGASLPNLDILQRICQFFDVDARILTHRLADLRINSDRALPPSLMEAFDPVPHDLFPDGFYELWSELNDSSRPYCCLLLHVKTIDGVRLTKVVRHTLVLGPDGTPNALDGFVTVRGVAVKQAGGVCILDRPDHHTGLTFTALRLGIYGDPCLLAGHKKSVSSVVERGLMFKSATAMRRLKGGFREAMFVRRLPRYRTAEETPELIQWMLKEQQATAEYG